MLFALSNEVATPLNLKKETRKNQQKNLCRHEQDLNLRGRSHKIANNNSSLTH